MRMMNRGFFVVENVDFNIKTSHAIAKPPPANPNVNVVASQPSTID